MSNKNKLTPANTMAEISYGYGYLIHQYVPDTLNGRLFEIIEAVGLPSKQEESLKNLIRKNVWDAITEDAISVSPETHTPLRVKQYQNKQQAAIAGNSAQSI